MQFTHAADACAVAPTAPDVPAAHMPSLPPAPSPLLPTPDTHPLAPDDDEYIPDKHSTHADCDD